MPKKKSEKQKLRDKLDREYLQGYRVGFDTGYVDGVKYGRAQLQEQLRDLLNAEGKTGDRP
jgi:flagellar biosynthesis/type III secretory pathway protein FliH